MTNQDPAIEMHRYDPGFQPPDHGGYGGAPEELVTVDVEGTPAPSVLQSEGPQTGLRPDLKERHVNMIGFSMVLGVGLFLQAGQVIYIAGPGRAVIAFLLVGSAMWATMASMGEMTALFPVKGPTFEFVRRFMDESVGYACAWMLWISCVIVAAAEILAITELFRFQVDPNYLEEIQYPDATVEWDSTLGVDPAVWVGIFLIIELLVNLLPVRFYGRLEYLFGCIKIIFLVALILTNTILNARQRFHSDRFWTYNPPWGFGSQNFTVVAATTDTSNDAVVYQGSLATFTSLWTAMTTAFFSLMGWDVILLTAPENKDLTRNETIKLSSRKIALRVMLLYGFAVFTVGLNVPYTEKGMGDSALNSIRGGQNSAFVLAALLEHVPFLPHFLNGFFIFSATSTGINCLYASSRLLHAIASLQDAWPSWAWVEAIRSRLELTRLGVPMNAVLASWFVAFLAFLARRPDSSNPNVRSSSSETLGRMATVSSTATLIVYALNCFTFLLFYKELERVVSGKRDKELNIPPGHEQLRNNYRRRNNGSYPYPSHIQWLRALYGFVFCSLLIIFQGWSTLVPPFQAADFVASYIAIVIFFVLTAAYFFKSRGFNPSRWQFWTQRFEGLQAIGPIVVQDPNHRRGVLRWPRGEGEYGQKAKVVLQWIWVWLK